MDRDWWIADICRLYNWRNEEDARFSYAEEYLSGNIARPISIHLPLSENAFSVDDTRN